MANYGTAVAVFIITCTLVTALSLQGALPPAAIREHQA